MSSKQSNKVVVISEDGSLQSPKNVESGQKLPLRQKRLLSWMFDKHAPPIPSGEERQIYPQNLKNVFEYLFFRWLNPLYKVGYRRTVVDADLWELNDFQTVQHHHAIFETFLDQKIRSWNESQTNGSERDKWPVSLLILSCVDTFRYRCIAAIVVALLMEGSLICVPVITKKIITYVDNQASGTSSSSIGVGIGYAFLSGVITMFANLCFNHMSDLSMRVGIDCKSVLIKQCFKKSMKLSKLGRKEFPVGKITSLIGNDLSRFEYFFVFGCMIFGMVMGMIIIVALLISNLGVSSLPGIGLLLITCGFQGWASKRLFKSRANLNSFTDERVSTIREIISSFKMIKYYCWEDAYFEKVSAIRSSELRIFLTMKLTRNLIQCASLSFPLLSTMISFLVLYKLKGISDIASIFSSLSLFSILSNEISLLPMVFSSITDAYSALKRVLALLSSEEELVQEKCNSEYEKTGLVINFRNACFKWEEGKEEEVAERKKEQLGEAIELQSHISNSLHSVVSVESLLQTSFTGFHDLNFSIKKGEFLIIAGLIGSGKTSLLNAIAGNMPKISGLLQVDGSKIYCGDPWLQNASIKENIVFGSEYEEDKYQEIISCCAFADDFRMFKSGDNTEVGERGITLSGGQKSRINLARAMYRDMDIILMDDVLSAVDAKVGSVIVNKCLLGSLKQKTRILATHQLSLVWSADRVIFLAKDGSVHTGTAEELSTRFSEFSQLLTFSKLRDTIAEEEGEPPVNDQTDSVLRKEAPSKPEEKKAVNKLSWKVYKEFLFSGSGISSFVPAPILLMSLALATFSSQFTNIWLSFWTETRFQDITQDSYMGIYIMFNFLTIAFSLSQLTSLSWVVNNASKNLVIRAVHKVLHSTMSFIDTTPTGQILNRFTKDTEVLDNQIIQSLQQLLSYGMSLIGILVLTMVYIPWLIIAIPVLGFLCFAIADYGQSSTRETKRIEAVRRSFIFNNINETLSGLETIKAYKSEERFLQKNDKFINDTNVAQWINSSSQRWLGLHLSMVSLVYGFLVTVLAVTGVFHLSASSVGLVLSAMFTFGENLSVVFRSMVVVENSMNSAERLYQYAVELEQEAPSRISEHTPHPEWPINPSIMFDKVQMSYRTGLPPVLNGLSFNIEPFQKVGICGRTGAGKSSIMAAIYRISELQLGSILIDGVALGNMGLKDLRSKLSIIPQEAVVFRGTIRFNLDPLGEHSDEQLIEAIRKSGLSKEEGKFGLDLVVDDEGTNYSMGQKQLIALARALVKQSKILLLDEATSNIDFEMDEKVQNIVLREFRQSTVLCIAHRLKTILSYDKILVLDAGAVKQFDSPYNLFCDEGGLFREMCQKAGITKDDFKSQF